MNQQQLTATTEEFFNDIGSKADIGFAALIVCVPSAKPKQPGNPFLCTIRGCSNRCVNAARREAGFPH
jgi:hypothetical protein